MLLLSMSLCTEVEGLGEGPISEFCALPPGLIAPPPVVHGSTEGQVGQDYVSSELALPCARSGWTLPQGTPALRRWAPQGGDSSGGGGGHWQSHREQSGLAAVVHGPRSSWALRTTRRVLCTIVVACRALCAMLCARWCRALCGAVGAVRAAPCGALCAASCGALCAVLCASSACTLSWCCALHTVLLVHPGVVPCPLFPVPLHPPLPKLPALPALWGGGGGGVRDRNGSGVARPPVPAG